METAEQDTDALLEARLVALEEASAEQMHIIAQHAEALEQQVAFVAKQRKTIARLVEQLAERDGKLKKTRDKLKKLGDKFDLLNGAAEDTAKVATGLVEQLGELSSLVTG